MTPPSSRSTMWGTVTAWPFPLLMKGRHGYSEPYRWKISGEARHCCHACPDLSHSAQHIVPTTPACTTRRRWGRLSVGGPKAAWAPEDGPVGVGLPGVGRLLPRAPRAINQTRWGVATVIAQ